MGRHTEQDLPLRQRLFHQPEFVMFEIAQAAVDQLAGVGRGGRGEIARPNSATFSPARRICRDADPVDAAADDDQIIMFAHVHHFLILCLP